MQLKGCRQQQKHKGGTNREDKKWIHLRNKDDIGTICPDGSTRSRLGDYSDRATYHLIHIQQKCMQGMIRRVSVEKEKK